jgi:aminoglycoside phosphotransferase (APT) family kinase protein
MIAGTPEEARWIRSEPRRTLPAALVERAVHAAFPRCRVISIEPLTDGFRNANLKLRLDSLPEPIVLRIYEHDASICQKEADVMRLAGRVVPIPEVLHLQPRGAEDIPPFTLMRYVEGVSFRDLKRRGTKEEVAQAAYSAGKTLAAMGGITFPKSGWLAPGPIVSGGLLNDAGPDILPRFIDLCLANANLQRRIGPELRDRAHALIWSCAPRLDELDDDACLVHCDFGNRNLVVGNAGGKWSVAAVLDWEFAISGTPLIDLGHFLRYERQARPLLEPHFSRAYADAGGDLPPDWRQLARLLDLSALCESLTHDKLPPDVVAELSELFSATVENRDPRLS